MLEKDAFKFGDLKKIEKVRVIYFKCSLHFILIVQSLLRFIFTFKEIGCVIGIEI